MDLPLANKSLDWVARNIKNPNFEKYSKYFLRLGHWPASELRKNFCVGLRLEHATGSTRNWVARTRQHYFWNFDNFFVKTKYFPKTTKHLKSFLWLINRDWAYENTFKQLQSHKWIWHSLNIDMCDVCGYQQWDSP